MRCSRTSAPGSPIGRLRTRGISDAEAAAHARTRSCAVSHPWHQTFLLGDNELTLDPLSQVMIEAQANYGTGQPLFVQGGLLARRGTVSEAVSRLGVLSSTSIEERKCSGSPATWRALRVHRPPHAQHTLIPDLSP